MDMIIKFVLYIKRYNNKWTIYNNLEKKIKRIKSKKIIKTYVNVHQNKTISYYLFFCT